MEASIIPPRPKSSVLKRTRACLECGEDFLLNPCHAKEHLYCSARCRAQHHRGTKQLALPTMSRVERAFAEWIQSAAGRYVEREVVRLAREDKAQGDRRGEMNLYFALVRRSARGLQPDPAGFSCNNNWRSLLARKVMAECPDLAAFFRTRDLRGVR